MVIILTGETGRLKLSYDKRNFVFSVLYLLSGLCCKPCSEGKKVFSLFELFMAYSPHSGDDPSLLIHRNMPF